MSAPGWHPDPAGSGQQRYFDGSTWTDQYAPASPTAPAPAAAPKKSNRGKIVLGVLAAVVLLVIVASLAGGNDDNKPSASGSSSSAASTPAAAPSAEAPAPIAAEPPTSGSQITYEVQSDDALSTVTYFDALNELTQLSDQPANWSTSFEGKATFQMHSLSAQTTGTQVSCRITVGGNVLVEQAASGRYAVVTCAG